MSRDHDLLLGTLAAVVAAVLFGTLGPLSRFGAEAGVGGVAFTAWRAVLGVAFLAVLVTARGAAGSSFAAVRSLSGRGRAALATAAIMGVTLNVSMFTAFGLVPIALALMLFYLYPAGVVVVDLALGHERSTRSRLVALAFSFCGVALVLFGGATMTDGQPLSPLGIVLCVVAAASQVVFMTVSRGGYARVPADAATIVILAASVVGASTIAILVGQGATLAPLRSLDPWPILLVAGILAAGVSSLLFLTAIRTIGGTRTGILMLLEPVVGVVLAALLLGEALGPLQAAGGGLVLAGALVLQLRSEPALEPIAETHAGRSSDAESYASSLTSSGPSATSITTRPSRTSVAYTASGSSAGGSRGSPSLRSKRDRWSAQVSVPAVKTPWSSSKYSCEQVPCRAWNSPLTWMTSTGSGSSTQTIRISPLPEPVGSEEVDHAAQAAVAEPVVASPAAHLASRASRRRSCASSRGTRATTGSRNPRTMNLRASPARSPGSPGRTAGSRRWVPPTRRARRAGSPAGRSRATGSRRPGPSATGSCRTRPGSCRCRWPSSRSG